jgi:hypothetical protein
MVLYGGAIRTRSDNWKNYNLTSIKSWSGEMVSVRVVSTLTESDSATKAHDFELSGRTVH